MTVQPDPDALAILAQARLLTEQIETIEARLDGLGPGPDADSVAAALAEPVRALGAAAKEA